MASFFEGQTSRAERYRKQQLYKNMLDEQLQYQNLNKVSQSSSNKFPLSKSRLSQPYDHYVSKNIYQPPKRLSYSRKSPTPKTRILTQAQQGTEKYLQSCEQIMSNLKSLTQKRKQKQQELSKLQNRLRPVYKSKKQEEDQVSRYLRSRNSDSSYKNQGQQSSKKQKIHLKPLQINHPPSKSTQYGKSVKLDPSKKKLRKIHPLQKSHRSYSSRSRSESGQAQPIQQPKIMNPEQKQVYETMIELMKYFKAKQEQMEQQGKKAKLVSSEAQVDTILDKEQTDKQRQQSNQSDLKIKALIKLRNLNMKSRQLVEKFKKAKEENQTKSQQGQPKIQHRLRSRLEDEIKKQKIEQYQNKKAKEQSQNQQLLKAITNQLSSQEKQNQSLTKCLIELSQILKHQNQEIQTFKHSQVQAKKNKPQSKNIAKPQNNNNNRNKTNVPLKFRAEEFPKVKKGPPLSPTLKKEEKAKVQHTKEQQQKLKEAFLKKLRKLRLRGKQFNDKLQTYKKQYKSQNQQYQQNYRNPQIESQSPRDMKLTKQQA